MSVFKGDEFRPMKHYKPDEDALFPRMWRTIDNEDARHDTQAAAGVGVDARDRAWAAQWLDRPWGDPEHEFNLYMFSWRWTP